MDMYPVMVAMFLAIQFLKQSELLMDCSHLMYRHIQMIPASIWPLIVFRPISGSASLALMIDIFKVYGPDSLEGILASVIQSSTDTTLYVLTLYFGSIQIKNTKNALFIGLFADVVGISIAILLVLLFFSC